MIKQAILDQRAKRNVSDSGMYCMDLYNDNGRIYCHIFDISMKSYFGGMFKRRIILSGARINSF